ncbi:hypothetical protein WMY93_017266 [Mugilogobius chulae]|uniref:Immunoglobulin V-set domain-containing protein n=1 Tax=Mugilogobius chulae TaxID=88201 RepID=A0AAW0NU46_9GOBI
MSSYNKYNTKGEFFDTFKTSRRFKLNNTKHYNNLTIEKLHISDAATYFCMSSNLYKLDFLEAFALDVEGAGFTLSTLVFDSMPENANVQSRSEKLDCSFDSGICHEEHTVYEFSPSAESQKGILYSPEGEKCESKTTHSSTNACVYNLPMQDENATKDWTKCAVATCGKLLFGRKSKPGDKDMASVLMFVLTGALVVTLILTLLLTLAIYKIKKKAPPAVTEENEENVHYAALKHHASNKTIQQRDSTDTECVYSGVRM